MIHAEMDANVRVMVEELFGVGFITLVTVNTFHGSTEITRTPWAKSFLVMHLQ